MNIKKRHMVWAAVFVIFISIAAGFIYSNRTKNNPPDDILSINLREHKNLALHIHPVLQIEILGDAYPIPADVGISNSGMKVIHTHDFSGTLHVESPYPHEFLLKDFFTIWGKKLDGSCIFEYCEDDSHTLAFFVNGQESELRENMVLRDEDTVKIVYAEKK